MNRKELKSLSKSQLKGKRGILIVIYLLTMIVNVGSQFLINSFESEIVGFIVSMVLSLAFGTLGFGMMRIYLDVAKGEEVSVYKLFDGFKGAIFFKIIGLNILMGLAVCVSTLLLIIPGIIVALMLTQCLYILCEDESKGIIKCMSESKALMKGYKWDYFVLGLSFIGWGLLGVITCGIGFLWIMPYMTLTYTNYYLKLKELNGTTKETINEF